MVKMKNYFKRHNKLINVYFKNHSIFQIIFIKLNIILEYFNFMKKKQLENIEFCQYKILNKI